MDLAAPPSLIHLHPPSLAPTEKSLIRGLVGPEKRSVLAVVFMGDVRWRCRQFRQVERWILTMRGYTALQPLDL